MLTSKQRAYLRGLANPIEAKHQIGKEGVNENHRELLCAALEANELIKISVLESVMEPVRSICDQLVELCKAEPVQVIGRKIVLYKRSAHNPKIELPKNRKKK
ncbi:MAG: YhbY family RNA-binding protein [Eubacteriales bacterium]|nr:YhbY family RNA-binding protein [Eubacteriales bacterium]